MLTYEEVDATPTPTRDILAALDKALIGVDAGEQPTYSHIEGDNLELGNELAANRKRGRPTNGTKGTYAIGL